MHSSLVGCLAFCLVFFFSQCLSQGTLHCCLVAKLCPTLCDPMDCGPPGSSVHRISQARILECHFLFQGIFPTQDLKLLLLHRQAYLLPLSPLGSPGCTQKGTVGVDEWMFPKCYHLSLSCCFKKTCFPVLSGRGEKPQYLGCSTLSIIGKKKICIYNIISIIGHTCSKSLSVFLIQK